jgi:hypothetical protein
MYVSLEITFLLNNLAIAFFSGWWDDRYKKDLHDVFVNQKCLFRGLYLIAPRCLAL